MKDQLKVWETYTDRNKADWPARVPVFQRILDSLPIRRVLEVGCGRGQNLVALAELLGPKAEVVAVEPNQYARETARASSPKIGVLRGNACDLPFHEAILNSPSPQASSSTSRSPIFPWRSAKCIASAAATFWPWSISPNRRRPSPATAAPSFCGSAIFPPTSRRCGRI